MSVGVKGLVRFLIWNRLIDNEKTLSIAEMYYVRNMSPSTIANTLNISIGVVRGKINRIKQFALKEHVVSYIIRSIYGDIMKIEPIIEKNGGNTYRCNICRKYIYGGVTDSITLLRHIENVHEDLINKYIYMLLMKIASEARKKSSLNT